MTRIGRPFNRFANGNFEGFVTYVFRDKAFQNLIFLILFFCQFVLFKVLYPFPDFFSDSYSYINAADKHLGANIWPIGYSWFLAVFHWFTHSPTLLNLFQYLLFELVALYFYRTIEFLFSPGKPSRLVLSIFLFYNPLNLYLANFVSSDGMFAALSLLWLTELIWTIYRPNYFHLITLSLACFVAFTFRYNAMYYPLVAVPAFIAIKKNTLFKAIGILLGPCLIVPFIIYSSNAAKLMSGTPQFPPILGGWQWANNALYIREYVYEDSTSFPTLQMAELDSIARDYYRNVPAENRQLSSYVGNFFIKDWNAPLKTYMLRHYPINASSAEPISWAKVAPLFKEYGLFLIKRHPIPFVRHYILLNAKNYFLPPLEKLELYNLGEDYMARNAMYWFGYHTNKVHAVSKTFHGYLFAAYPTFFMLVNLWFGWNLIAFIRRKGFSISQWRPAYTFALMSSLALTNAAFSIFANIVVFRYQIFPMYTLLAIALLLGDWNLKASQDQSNISTSN